MELSGGADAVELRIADDGAGFDPRLADGKGGLGLVSMRERLRLVGGAIAIDSHPGAGTRSKSACRWAAPGLPRKPCRRSRPG